MEYSISSQNVADYINNSNLYRVEQISIEKTTSVAGKNFNLLLELSDKNSILVKQERQYSKGQTLGEFSNEWQIHRLLQEFTELDSIRLFFPEILHFDVDNSVIVFKYQKNYQDLAEFYAKERLYPVHIAEQIGKISAEIHKATEKKEYENFWRLNQKDDLNHRVSELTRDLERITPEIFGIVTDDGLKFYSLYQRYDSLRLAIMELLNSLQSRCLIHGDLKLNNILLHEKWQKEYSNLRGQENPLVRLIDWERVTWGDPAFDLGAVIASYLQIWLGSLIVSKGKDIKASIDAATTPLKLIQPSITALIDTYLSNFPRILDSYPDFLLRVIQYAGFSLIMQIQAMIQRKQHFSNNTICMLQVAKSLLCQPEQSIPTIFGTTKSEIIRSRQ